MKKADVKKCVVEESNTAEENVVSSFADMLKDKGITVQYLTPKEAKEAYNHGLEEETRKLLNTEMLINGSKTTPAKYVAAAQVAYTMDNPNPAVVGQLRKNIGDDIQKMEVGGLGIETFFDMVKPDEDNDVADA